MHVHFDLYIMPKNNYQLYMQEECLRNACKTDESPQLKAEKKTRVAIWTKTLETQKKINCDNSAHMKRHSLKRGVTGKAGTTGTSLKNEEYVMKRVPRSLDQFQAFQLFQLFRVLDYAQVQS